MKIRTDFITNSSSSSFVTVIAEFKNGLRKKAELEYGYGAGPLSSLRIKKVTTGKELLDALDRFYDAANPRGWGNDYASPKRENLSPQTQEYLKRIVDIEAIQDCSELSCL